MGRKTKAQLEKEEKEELEKQKAEEESEKIEETIENEEPEENPKDDKKITLENYKIKKGIPDYIYKAFKINLEAKKDFKYDLKELDRNYEEFLNKKI